MLRAPPRKLSSLIGFTVGFTGLGLFAASELRPTAGAVALVNSAGFWSRLIVTGLAYPAAFGGASVNPTTLYAPALIAANAGLIGGALLSPFFRASRLRMFLIDVGGALGGLFGAARRSSSLADTPRR